MSFHSWIIIKECILPEKNLEGAKKENFGQKHRWKWHFQPGKVPRFINFFRIVKSMLENKTLQPSVLSEHFHPPQIAESTLQHWWEHSHLPLFQLYIWPDFRKKKVKNYLFIFNRSYSFGKRNIGQFFIQVVEKQFHYFL